VKQSVEKQLTELKTDYIDYGFIHCLDEEKDWETFQKNGILEYIYELKKSGVVRHIGLSSHTPALIQKILDEVGADLLMFSINPAYDFEKGDEYGIGSLKEIIGRSLKF
jgi:predicted aldo/keto reductase-like oxidoreductase